MPESEQQPKHPTRARFTSCGVPEPKLDLTTYKIQHWCHGNTDPLPPADLYLLDLRTPASCNELAVWQYEQHAEVKEALRSKLITTETFDGGLTGPVGCKGVNAVLK